MPSFLPRASTMGGSRFPRRSHESSTSCLTAHDDTIGLVGVPPADQRWSARVEYLRALQRCGREILAHATLTSGT